MKTTYLETAADIEWLFSTHLQKWETRLKGRNCKAAIIHGNEDCPQKIELFYVAPRVNSKPRHVLALDENGDYILLKK